MTQNLVVVESPAKAKTIEKYLGAGWTVLASYGHIRDLPRSDFAIEIESDGDVELRYEVPANSKKHVAALRQAAREADKVWLAPDLDREGEAIAWHVAQVLGLDTADENRVTFDEITKPAILAAFEEPRPLNLALIDAQQARRAVDRIVGYRLSPVLWRTVSSGISAGRVQSVALRLLVDREDEIRAFVPREYWSMLGHFADEPEAAPRIDGKLHSVGGRRIASPKDLQDADEEKLKKRLLIASEEQATELAALAREHDYVVREVRRSERRQNPKAPFTTSTLQQDAANKLGFSARQTMSIAQQLYEGINLGGGEQVGLITYMRTDSVNLSEVALAEINTFVDEKYGERYGIEQPRTFSSKAKRAQEAHEAIRPTSVNREPFRIKDKLSAEQFKLYSLIWKRTVATQMTPAVYDQVSADVVGGEGDDEFLFRVTGKVLKFEGYLKVYNVTPDLDAQDEDEETDSLPDITEGATIHLRDLEQNQHFTTPPPRYTEATLVKTLEAEGIGRPSTYASIISTLVNREYVRLESRRFFTTPLGEVVTSFLKAHFSEIVDVGFTARMESTLDEIAEGEEQWSRTVTRFLDEVDEWVKERKPERPRLPLLEPTDCHECGAPMEKVFSGKSKQWFASCSRWPDCDGTRPLNEDGTVGEPEPEPEPDPDVLCEICGQPMLLRSGRFGQFYGCVDYPKCKGIRNLQQRGVYLDRDVDESASPAERWRPFISPTDGKSHMELRKSRYGKPFLGSAGYPDDAFAIWSIPLADPCPKCGAPLRPPPKNRKVPTAVCANPELEHVFELDDFDAPRVHSIEVVPGIEKYDPEVGGEPINGWPEDYAPIDLTFVREQKPKPKPKAKKAATKKAAAKKSTGKKKAAPKGSKKAPSSD